MRLEEQVDLGAEVETIGNFLDEEFKRLLVTEFRETVKAWPDQPGNGDHPLPRQEIHGLAERFWRAALKSEGPFFSMASPPVKLLQRLHSRWIERLRGEAKPCFAPALQCLRATFPDLYALDGGRLDDIARRLRLVHGDGMVFVPGRFFALHDLFRGLPVRLWFSADDESPDRANESEVAGSAGEGSLVLADARSATPAMLAALREAGAYGAFRLRPRPAMNGNGKTAKIEDIEISTGEADGTAILRRITSVQDGKVIGVLTDVLDRDRLPASQALLLAVPRWKIDRLLTDAGAVVDLARANLGEPAAIEAQLHAAAILDAGLRTAQGWIAERRGLPATAIAVKFIFPRIAGTVADRSVLGEDGIAARGIRSDLSSIRPSLRIPTASRLPVPAPRQEMARIGGTEVEPAFEPFCQEYASVGHRNGFLWKWVQRGINLTALPSVEQDWRSPNRTAKLLGVMLDVLLDDVADNCQFKDRRFLEILLGIPFGDTRESAPRDPGRLRYHRFAEKVWNEIMRLAATFPRYREFAEVLEFDYRQLLNTMRYAFLANNLPEIFNSIEHDLYQPHNMHMMISGTLDVMCSPGFDRNELRLLRQALWHGQVMGRIGNMVSTWEREIRERDFTSGVFAAAIERGAFLAVDMPNLDPAELTSAIERSGVVEDFLRRWVTLRDAVVEIADQVRSVDLHPVAAGLEELIRLHLGSRGLK